MKLSDTQPQILLTAAAHDALPADPPASLPTAARQAVIRSMLKNDLLAEVSAPALHTELAWRLDEAGAPMVLRVTNVGLRAICITPDSAEAPTEAALAEHGGKRSEEAHAGYG